MKLGGDRERRRRRRAKRLAEAMHANVAKARGAAVIACCPVDTSTLPVLDGVQLPVPSIEHSIVRCGDCGTEVWIGPTQAELAKLGHPVWCYLCLARSGTLLVDARSFALDPHAAHTPRRSPSGLA